MKLFLRWALSVSLLMGATLPLALAKSSATTAEELREAAVEAYIYAYPMVLMEVTRRVSTNVEAPVGLRAPVNQIAHARTFPEPSFTDVVRPNADTLYSAVSYDVGSEPLVFSIPDSGSRYYLMPFMDFWTDVFTSPGSRTTGTKAQTFAIVGPRWQGTLPRGVAEYRSPTNRGLLIGRTQTNGKADYKNVQKFQDGIRVYPLSAHGKSYVAPKGVVNSKQDMSAPPDIVEKMSGEQFFTMFASLLKENPPHGNDYPVIDRMRRLGIQADGAFEFSRLSMENREALSGAPSLAIKKIKESLVTGGIAKNGWRISMTAIGTYGADYLRRAGVAFAGLGANVIEDAVYPMAFADDQGKPFHSDKLYKIHFTKDQLPPVRAFWSLTMYDERQLFAANPLGRYAIGDRDNLKFNKDGSLDIYIQRTSPGKERESNWLPAPKSGAFTLTMRLYWPKAQVLDGSWAPPSVQNVSPNQSLSLKE